MQNQMDPFIGLILFHSLLCYFGAATMAWRRLDKAFYGFLVVGTLLALFAFILQIEIQKGKKEQSEKFIKIIESFRKPKPE